MIQSDTVWATSAAFMNDANEMKSGTAALRRLHESRKGSLPQDLAERLERSGLFSQASVYDNFLLSASSKGDSLTHWRYYGVSEVAFSVGMDRTVKLVPVEQVQGSNHPQPVPPGYYDREFEENPDGSRSFIDPDPDEIFASGGEWLDVTYIEDESSDQIVELYDQAVGRAAKSLLLLLWPAFTSVLTMKDNGFEDEAEVRLVVNAMPSWKFVRYRPGRFGPIPYVTLTSGKAGSRYAVAPVGLPIREIRIGPTRFGDEAERSLRQLLDDKGYGDVRILRSVTPYR